ncbi:MAG: hypothetical protein ACSHXK_09595 [Oceanococcus sp.]
MSTALASLLLGMLSGVNLLFAIVLLPALFHLLALPSTRSYALHVLSVYTLFCAALSGAALVLMFASPCTDALQRALLSLVCGSYWLAWQQLRARLSFSAEQLRQKQIQAGLQILNTAQLAVCSMLFMRLAWVDACW